MKKIGVLRFPGTNCDRDVWKAVSLSGDEPHWLWHEDRFNVKDFDGFVIPGGFSYGDYLRSGALAAKAPAMMDVRDAADKGNPVVGICNGFQILCETGILPGALMKNGKQRFIDKWVKLKKVGESTKWGSKFKEGESYDMPIAHADGRYHIDSDGLKELYDNGQVWWVYDEENPNGSVEKIAGVTNLKKNVSGLMPHPERATELWMGGNDGKAFFEWS